MKPTLFIGRVRVRARMGKSGLVHGESYKICGCHGNQYQLTPLLMDERLSYLRSLSMDDLTAMLKL